MIASSFCNADSMFSREEGIDVRKMMGHKRSPCSVDQSSYTSIAPKKQKADLSISSKDRKEKFGERIVTLQQLVSPYGKTDTSSVLKEAMDYIGFLHKQVKVWPFMLHYAELSYKYPSKYFNIPQACLVYLDLNLSHDDLWS